MFTGLVETVGTIRAVAGSSPKRLTIGSSIPVGEVAIGASISINGCCLTVVEKGADTLAFEAATETLERTSIGVLRVGDRVNLERSLKIGDELGGHLVSGHVDGLGVVKVREKRGSAVYFGIEAPWEVMRLTAARGSVCVAGVSLTVTDVSDTMVWVGIIPHTLDVTTFGDLKAGDAVNLEADLVARYLERLTYARAKEGDAQVPGLTVEYLKDKGFA